MIFQTYFWQATELLQHGVPFVEFHRRNQACDPHHPTSNRKTSSDSGWWTEQGRWKEVKSHFLCYYRNTLHILFQLYPVSFMYQSRFGFGEAMACIYVLNTQRRESNMNLELMLHHLQLKLTEIKENTPRKEMLPPAGNISVHVASFVQFCLMLRWGKDTLIWHANYWTEKDYWEIVLFYAFVVSSTLKGKRYSLR